MTPADLLEVISFEEGMQARVGDIVASRPSPSPRPSSLRFHD